MAMVGGGLGLEQVTSRRSRWGRRLAVIALGTILAVVACGVIGVALVQGSWWYPYGTDRALDRESRARLEAIRDRVSSSGAAPEAVEWLDTALEPNAHPTDARAYLFAAQEMLDATADPELAEAAQELRTIIETIRSSEVTVTLTLLPSYFVPTPQWPGGEQGGLADRLAGQASPAYW